MGEKEDKGRSETRKHGFTAWLRPKFLGKSKQDSLVDTEFLADLSDMDRVDRYEIIDRLGQGSMGVVYLGRDPYIKRKVAIKVTRPGAHVKGEKAHRYRERFFTEAQSVGGLLHSNIVAVYDAGMYKDFCYMTMEYIDGPTLEKFCQKDYLLPIPNAVQVVITTCKALDYAHKRGVVHRDIKPGNIMLSKAGYVKISDFGIAQIKSEQSVSEGVIGSSSYMSPEQVKDVPDDNKTDIFSLGCIFYELLTGEKAFPGEEDFTVMYKIVREDPVPIEEIRPEVPGVLSDIVEKALVKDPQKRYQTCGDFAYDLSVALRDLRGTVTRPEFEDVIDYIHGSPFFEEFSDEQIKEILGASKIVNVPKGEVVVTEGEIDDSFYIVLSGSAAVHKNDEKIGFIGRGECFGEMALISGQVRSATVSAETECVLLKIGAGLLDRASTSVQLLFLRQFALTLVKRLSTGVHK